MERKLICLDKNDSNDIDFYLRTGEYTDKDFNSDYGINIKKKNQLYMSENLITKKEYRYLNYIEINKLDASLLLKLMIDMYKEMGDCTSPKREQTYESMSVIESAFLSLKNEHLVKINYSGINKSDFLNLPPRILGIIDAANIDRKSTV